MPMTEAQAKEWQKKNSPFLKLGDGEKVEVTLRDMKAVPAKDPSKETMRYIVINEDGAQKFWDSASGALAVQMSALIGKKISISRVGTTSTDTKYTVAEVK